MSAPALATALPALQAPLSAAMPAPSGAARDHSASRAPGDFAKQLQQQQQAQAPLPSAPVAPPVPAPAPLPAKAAQGAAPAATRTPAPSPAAPSTSTQPSPAPAPANPDVNNADAAAPAAEDLAHGTTARRQLAARLRARSQVTDQPVEPRRAKEGAAAQAADEDPTAAAPQGRRRSPGAADDTQAAGLPLPAGPLPTPVKPDATSLDSNPSATPALADAAIPTSAEPTTAMASDDAAEAAGSSDAGVPRVATQAVASQTAGVSPAAGPNDRPAPAAAPAPAVQRPATADAAAVARDARRSPASTDNTPLLSGDTAARTPAERTRSADGLQPLLPAKDAAPDAPLDARSLLPPPAPPSGQQGDAPGLAPQSTPQPADASAAPAPTAAPAGASFAVELLRAQGVAETLRNAAPAPAPTELQLSTPVSAPEFVPRLSGELAVLARDGVQEARVQVHPVELGPISVQISLDGSAAQVHLAVDNAQTRELLEQAMPSLAAALRENGLTLTGGGVFQQARQNARQDAPDRSDGSRASGPGRRELGSVAAAGTTSRVTRHAGVVDLYA